MDLRDLALYWWPVVARLFGLVIGGHEMLTPPSDSGTLGFAGLLIVAPYVADQQRKRNARRLEREADSEESGPEG